MTTIVSSMSILPFHQQWFQHHFIPGQAAAPAGVWLPSLTELHLQDNCISNLSEFSWVFSCPNLKVLDLGFNKLTNIEHVSYSIQGLSYLERWERKTKITVEFIGFCCFYFNFSLINKYSCIYLYIYICIATDCHFCSLTV